MAVVVVLPCVPATTIEVWPGNEIVFEQLRHRAVGNFLVEDVFDFRVAARIRVADDAEIGRGLEVFFAEAFVPLDAERIEQGRGGRIDVDIRPGDAETPLLQHARNGRHGRARDSQQMDVLGVLSGALEWQNSSLQQSCPIKYKQRWQPQVVFG